MGTLFSRVAKYRKKPFFCAMATKKKFYVVWVGAKPGIYLSWSDCEAQIKGFPGARYQSFPTKEEAQAAFSAPPPSKSTTPKATTRRSGKPISAGTYQPMSLCVDAACSGNPGVMEYQGVYTRTGQQLFHKKFQLGTNNIGEFLGIVHALAFLQKEGQPPLTIYSDSENAIKWVRQKKCKTTLKPSAATAELFEVIRRAEQWLETNRYDNPILKWNTAAWGEIPADFGRK